MRQHVPKNQVYASALLTLGLTIFDIFAISFAFLMSNYGWSKGWRCWVHGKRPRLKGQETSWVYADEKPDFHEGVKILFGVSSCVSARWSRENVCQSYVVHVPLILHSPSASACKNDPCIPRYYAERQVRSKFRQTYSDLQQGKKAMTAGQRTKLNTKLASVASTVLSDSLKRNQLGCQKDCPPTKRQRRSADKWIVINGGQMSGEHENISGPSLFSITEAFSIKNLRKVRRL